jgi:hypothetical protein
MATPRDTWTRELARAAKAAAESGVDKEAFLRRAFKAFLDASPGLREELEDQRVVAEIAQLREAGRIAQA